MFGDNMVKVHEESFSPIVSFPGDSIVFTYQVDGKTVANYTHECVEHEVVDHMVIFKIKGLFGLKTGFVFAVGERE